MTQSEDAVQLFATRQKPKENIKPFIGDNFSKPLWVDADFLLDLSEGLTGVTVCK